MQVQEILQERLKEKFKNGQGLLETIVAIGVIITGLVSVMTLVISNLTNAREAALRYQAVNLAREGMELMRNKRDSNWLEDKNAWDGIATTVATLNTQTLPTQFAQFSRNVATANCVPNQDNTCAITATVTWQSSGGERNVELIETLYDWR